MKHKLVTFHITEHACQLIADALEIVNPEEENDRQLARDLAILFRYPKETNKQ